MAPLILRILENDRLAFEVPLTASLELGRQRVGEPEPYSVLPATEPGLSRVVIARQQESNCSRQHLLLQLLPANAVRVTNRSQQPLARQGKEPPIAAGASADLKPPLSFCVGPRTLTVGAGKSVDESGLQGLDGHTIAPGSLRLLESQLRPLPALSAPQFDQLIGWLQTTMGVLQSTVGSADFLPKAAEALVTIVGLDSGRVLLWKQDEWSVAAVHEPRPETDAAWQPSQRVLTRIRQENRTFWQTPQQAMTPDSPSLLSVHTAVASPLLDGEGNVIGALYGERRRPHLLATHDGGKLEAMLVELLACSISTGLARQEQQLAALKARVQFEQFFTPQLARQLRAEPDLLEGREAEVTLLFCDIRGFSRVSERLGPSGTVRWIGDVMSELSQCVLDQEGVLVDYVGDELLAMWGAPSPVADHVMRAASAALAMRGVLTTLNERWHSTLGEPIDLGIGINTGLVQVGNTGSRFKFKYGPLGNTVNLASRVQGLTKYLRCRLLVTAATRQHLGDRFIARRVCRARVVNIVDPVDLYEVEAAGMPQRKQFFQASEAALEALEAREFALAARRAGEVLLANPGDGPLLLVLSRAAQQLMQSHTPFDPVWEPPGK